jgi:hypothetical protein
MHYALDFATYFLTIVAPNNFIKVAKLSYWFFFGFAPPV